MPFDGTFIDRVKLRLKAGDGGDGIVSFRHEKYVPLGGPDGGDGGDGGSIILKINPGLNTLDKLHSQPYYAAESGQKGGKNNRTGRSGEDLYLDVPPGTIVRNADTRELLIDMENTEGEAVIARGGVGGKGNTRFATSTNQTPRKCTPGTPGDEFNALFELKLVAHVGLIGLPNAGKSTLISKVTNARPRIAQYPFTTLHPILGTIHMQDGTHLVIADIPGIIQGAHEGVGLGLDFLRHIERTKMLVFVVEISPHDPALPAQTLYDLRYEIEQYDPEILQRPYLVVLNKLDLLEDEEERRIVKDGFFELCAEIPQEQVCFVSALEKDGVQAFQETMLHIYRDQIQKSLHNDESSHEKDHL